MTLIVILNAVLAVLIVSVIVALHTGAILSDRRQGRRATALRPPVAHPDRPILSAPRYGRAPASGASAHRPDPVAA